MGILVLFFIFVISIGILIGSISFNKAKAKGASPWVWAIIGFLIAIILLSGAAFVYLAYFANFER